MSLFVPIFDKNIIITQYFNRSDLGRYLMMRLGTLVPTL